MKASNESTFPKQNLPEIVSPAGNEESFWAAVASGADAVYLGLKEFNARRRAENFDISEIPHLVKEAHLRNVKVYVTLNILLKNSELKQAFQLAEQLFESGVDALILQDLGFAQLLSKSFENIRLHASTQINAHNSRTLELLKALGFKRAVLARELTLTEIKKLAKKADIELEVFVHGALCYSYSGQCLFSSIVGARSGNRGLCAQPCRLQYELVANSNNRKIKMDLPFDYLISTRDLLGINRLYELINAGVSALKIEGRLKSAEYVALVTEVYAREIERAALLKENYQPLEESIEVLEEAFSRGFSPAYLEGLRANSMMSYTRPNNRGVFIGRVVYADEIGGKVGISLRKEIYRGDVLEFWTSKKGRVTQKINHLFENGEEKEGVEAGKRAHVVVEKDRHLIKPGDRVYRVVNAKLLDSVRKNARFFQKASRPVSFTVAIDASGRAEVVAVSGNYDIRFEEYIKVEKAEKAVTDEELVKEQFSKLGGTPYYLKDITVKVPDGTHIRLKEINRLRRTAVELLSKKILESLSRKPKKVAGETFLKHQLMGQKPDIYTPVFAVKTADKDMFYLALKFKPDIIFLRYPPFRNSGIHSEKDLVVMAQDASRNGVAFGLAFPEVVKDSEAEKYLEVLRRLSGTVSYVLSDNIGFLSLAEEAGFQVLADYHLNVTNALSAKFVSSAGARYVTLSVELNESELKEVAMSSGVRLGVLLAGDLEIMAAEHCPLTALSYARNLKEIERKVSTSKPCVLLAKEKEIYPRFCKLAFFSLRDRSGYEFPLRTDENCRAYVFNSRFYCLIDYLNKLYSFGINFFRVDLLVARSKSEQEEIKILLNALRSAFNDLKKGKAASIQQSVCPKPFTRGHIERGVL